MVCLLTRLWCIFLLGTKVEGILRQAADVEEVDRRVQEYEQGIISIQVSILFNALDEPENSCTFWKIPACFKMLTHLLN